MITHKKRKNSDKWYFPYLNLLVLVIIISSFVAMNLKVTESHMMMSQDTDIAAQTQSQDVNISGEWVGTTTEDYGDEALYDYRVVFEQDGDDLTGMLYLTRNHEMAIYTETRFEGWVNGDTIFYSSQEILLIENATRDQLCLVDTTVEYEIINGQETLIGTWQGQDNQHPGCDVITGRTILIRQPE